MKNGNRRRHLVRLSSVFLISAFILAVAVLAVPFHSARSSSLPAAGSAPARVPTSAPNLGAVKTLAGVRTAMGGVASRSEFANDFSSISGSSSGGLMALAALLAGSESIVVDPPASPRRAGCNDPNVFCLGETVTATVTNAPLRTGFRERRIQWVAPDGTVPQTVDVVSDPQTDTYTLDLVGQFAQVGKWSVRTITNRGGGVAVATFDVGDPTQPSCDLAVSMTGPSTATASTPITYNVTVTNLGPDSAVNVSLVNPVPYNTTFASASSTDDTFVCTTPNAGESGDIVCSRALLTANANVVFTFTFNVNSDVVNGTAVYNVAKVKSSTNEPNTSNNTADVSSTSAPPSGGGSCTLNCPDNITTPANTTEGGQRGAHVTYSAPVATGDCGTVTSSPASGEFFPVGTTTVTATSAQNGGSCSFTITVEEHGNVATITCPPNKDADTSPNDTSCEATVDPGSPTTGGENVTVEGTRSDGRPLTDPYPAGTTTITWTATSHDSSGNNTGSATCQQTITVHDKTPPAITCPANISVTTPTGSCSVTVNVGVPTATDNCDGSVTPVPSRSDNNPITDPFPLGTVTIHWTATDSSGNSSSCDQKVVVADNEPPVITCPSNVTTNTDPGTCSASNVNHGTATATDNCTVVTVSGTRSDGQPSLDLPYPKGTTTITWTATDASGNKSSCTQTITVEDHEPPSISCPAPTSASADANCQAPIPDVTSSTTASDNCGAVTLTQSPAAGTLVTLGTYTITVTATDSSGNQSSCTTTFTVQDTTPPTITLSSQTFSLSPPNHRYVTFQVTDFVTDAHDNCDTSVNRNSVYITKVTSDEAENGPGSGNTFNDIVIASDCKSLQLRAEREGGGDGRVYTIYFKVKDASGNTSTATAKVIVPVNPRGTAVDGPGPGYTVTSSCP